MPCLGVLVASQPAQLKLYGAQGLSFFANGVGIVTPESVPSLSWLNSRQPGAYSNAETEQHIGYRTGQEGPFIAYWRDWWQQHPELHTVN